MRPTSKPVKTIARAGASHSRTGTADRLRAWWGHHQLVAKDSLLRLLRAPLQSLLTWLVVAIAIALPGVLYLGLAQVQSLGTDWQSRPQLSAFIHYGAREEAVLALRDQVRARPDVAAVNYVSPQQALVEFEQYSGLGDVLATLDENPLPAVLLIEPAPQSTPAQLDQLRESLSGEALVDDVRLDMEWVRRLHQIMALGQRLVGALALLLAVGVLLVIGNTIRLAIENRRDEILVVKLVGGTDSFVRRPFLYTGFWYGLGGGLIACLLLLTGVQWLSGPVRQLAGLYQSGFELRGLSLLETLLILAGSGLLGLLGAGLAVGKHLHAIEPK